MALPASNRFHPRQAYHVEQTNFADTAPSRNLFHG
jgi:hypothetical protein